jgi:hypothetical protein
MKTRNCTFFVPYRYFSNTLLIAVLSSALFSTQRSFAQCGVGYTKATINWDNLDYYNASNANYTYFLNTWPWYRSQRFAFGTQKMEFKHAYANVTSVLGENATHTGDAGSFSTGMDVQFVGNGTINFVFDTEVRDLQFSIYDVDRQQRAAFGATNAAGVAQTINLVRAAGALSILTVTNNNTTTARVDASAFINVANNTNTGTVNATIAGPVKTVTITISNTTTGGFEDGSFWISDISACTNVPNFSNNYFAISRPLPGQPSYAIASPDNDTVYAINTTNGTTQYLFDMPGGSNAPFVNGLAYDPYKKILYYITEQNWLGTAAGAPFVSLWKYDFNTETSTQLIPDVRTRGIALFNRNVESGSSAFYDGKLYLGIEGSQAGVFNTGRESIIWRFDPEIAGDSGVQVYARPSDNGSRSIQDWGDITLKDGILYDFNSSTTDSDYVHYDMWNQNIVATYIPTSYLHIPRQAATQWDGTIVHIGDSVTTYNNGVLALPKTKITGNDWRRDVVNNLQVNNTAAGDATGSFRPRMDFGDAPASYYTGPDTAAHERDLNLRLGSTFDREWNAPVSANANADDLASGGDEDAIGGAPSLNYGATLNYTVNNISVFNNTGANATLIAWLDYNFDGVFQASEGRTVTVPTNTSTQFFNITWSSIWIPNTTATRTVLRLRLSSQANNMTTADMNRYMPDGEVEDYSVLRGLFLPDIKLQFAAIQNTNNVKLQWIVNDIAGLKEFEIERSADGNNWNTLVNKQTNSATNYTSEDNAPLQGQSYYRVKLVYADGKSLYSAVQPVYFSNQLKQVKLFPNPAIESAQLEFTSTQAGKATIELYNAKGIRVKSLSVNTVTGNNRIALKEINKLTAGTYTVYIASDNQIIATQLVIGQQ